MVVCQGACWCEDLECRHNKPHPSGLGCGHACTFRFNDVVKTTKAPVCVPVEDHVDVEVYHEDKDAEVVKVPRKMFEWMMVTLYMEDQISSQEIAEAAVSAKLVPPEPEEGWLTGYLDMFKRAAGERPESFRVS